MLNTYYVEFFWRVMKIKTESTDDQLAVNYAFYHMKIKWRLLKAESFRYFQGTTSDPVSLQVTLLPNNVICRHCTEGLKKTSYIWHPLSKKSGNRKKTRMTKDSTWKLSNNWNTTLQDTMAAEEWLLSIQ